MGNVFKLFIGVILLCSRDVALQRLYGVANIIQTLQCNVSTINHSINDNDLSVTSKKRGIMINATLFILQ